MINFKTEGKLIENFDLSQITRFRTGGKAELYFIPTNVNDLQNLILSNNKKLPIHIIGMGSNLLIRDGGLDGVTIRLQNNYFSKIEKINNTTIKCGAFTLNSNISRFAYENSITGFEFLSGIPGCIAGGIPTNAGCFNQELKDIIQSIDIIDKYTAEIKTIASKECNFSYRNSSLPENYIITSVILKGKIGNKEIIKEKIDTIRKTKDANQPSYEKTAGSTFKNPPSNPAWKLIKETDCQNLRFGDAVVSPIHANFIINNGNATSTDIENLITEIQKRVFEKFKINLISEIKIIGKKSSI